MTPNKAEKTWIRKINNSNGKTVVIWKKRKMRAINAIISLLLKLLSKFWNTLHNTCNSAVGRDAEYCNKHVCVSVSSTISLQLHFQSSPNFLCMLPMPSMLWRCWLGGRKGIRPVKNWVVRCWHGYLSGARCRLAYGPADATASHCLLLQ